MRRSRWLLLTALLLAALLPPAVAGQGKTGKDYHPLPFDGNLADMLKEQMLDAEGKELLKQLIKEKLEDMRLHPEKYKDLPKKVDPKSLDPATRKFVEDYLKNNKDEMKFTPEQIKAMEQVLKKQQEQEEAKPGKQQAAPKPDVGKAKPPEVKENSPPGKAGAGNFDWLVKKMMPKSAPSSMGKLSPRTQQSMREIQERLWYRDAHKTGATGDKATNEALSKAAHKVFENEGKLNLPELQFLKPPGDPGGSGANPATSNPGGPPGVPSLPTAAGGGAVLAQLLLIVAIIAVVVFLLWRWWNRQPAANKPAVALAGLGSWPLDPSQISTREQLIQAFEFLALLLLGAEARTANHLEIAGGLGETPERGQAADELAALYEKARYDPTAGELAPAELAVARRDLCLLAGLGQTAPAQGEG
jgi:hypothetical protein